MKELSVEEKAKRYDEAIKVAQRFYNNSVAITNKGLEDIFPELKESEDERIRENCIHFLELQKQHHAATFEIEECIAWLEKQGKENHISRDTKPRTYVDFYKRLTEPEQEYLQGYIDRVIEKTKELQRQGEQKPVPDWMPKFLDELRSKKNYFDWDEDKDIEGGILAIIKWMNPNYFNGKDSEQNSADKVEPKFNKGDILYEQKTMSILLVYERNGSWLMTFCDYWMLKEKFHVEFPYENYGFVQEMSLVPATKEQRDILFQKMHEAGYEWDAEKKELRKVGYSPAWSEEDEQHLLVCKNALAKYQTTDKWDANIISNWLENKLKSLRPQNTWKPSKEQMEALSYYIEYNVDSDGVFGRQLIKLYQDLKKLREE